MFRGLGSENVIILNNDSGKLGFPSLRADDPILNTLLSEADQFENGEERRLFYVALTRAKKHVYLFTPIGNKSKFITEFFEQNETHDKCPQCKKGDIRIISGNTNGRAWNMKSCSNFVYGCKFQEWE